MNISAPGNVYCAAFQPGIILKNVLNIRSTGVGTLTSVPYSIMTIAIPGLNADSNYDVYCYTEDFANHVMPITEAVSGKITTSTNCCREVALLTSFPSVVQYFTTTAVADESLFKLGLNAQPSSTVTVALSLTPVACAGSTSVVKATDMVTVPSTLRFLSTATDLTGQFVVRGNVAGCYLLKGTPSGLQSYRGFNYTVSIRNSRIGPDAPVVTTVVYSADGSKLLVNFNSDTNRAESVLGNAAFNTFSCARLLSFCLLYTSDAADE